MKHMKEIIVSVMIIVMAMPLYAFAEDGCDHNYVKEYSNISSCSETQHEIVTYYRCSKCGDSKSESTYENHSWKSVDKYNFKSLSVANHSYHESLRCIKCDAYKEGTGVEKHNLDKYNICQNCNQIVQKNISLKPKATAYINEKCWIKISVKSKGYLKVTSKGNTHVFGSNGEAKNTMSWNLYSKSKSKYLDNSFYGVAYVPIKKGTYYIKPSSYGRGSIQYTFTKYTPGKNTSKAKAKLLKRNKKAAGAIYPTDKKKTWKRYYRVNLTKKQFLRIRTSTFSNNNISVYDKFGKYVQMSTDEDKNGRSRGLISDNKLKKGSYYIEISGNWPNSKKKRYTGTYYQFYWK